MRSSGRPLKNEMWLMTSSSRDGGFPSSGVLSAQILFFFFYFLFYGFAPRTGPTPSVEVRVPHYKIPMAACFWGLRSVALSGLFAEVRRWSVRPFLTVPVVRGCSGRDAGGLGAVVAMLVVKPRIRPTGNAVLSARKRPHQPSL